MVHNIRKNALNITAIVIAAVVYMWSWFQLDGLAGGFGTLAPHWNELFAFWLYPTLNIFVVTKGMAWDLLGFLLFVSFIIPPIAIWFWQEDKPIATQS